MDRKQTLHRSSLMTLGRGKEEGQKFKVILCHMTNSKLVQNREMLSQKQTLPQTVAFTGHISQHEALGSIRSTTNKNLTISLPCIILYKKHKQNPKHMGCPPTVGQYGSMQRARLMDSSFWEPASFLALPRPCPGPPGNSRSGRGSIHILRAIQISPA